MTQSAIIRLPIKNIVGESLVWDFRYNRFLWVDIISKLIHAFDPQKGKHESWPTPDFVTSIGLSADGGYIVGLCHEITLWRPYQEFDTLAIPEPNMPNNRLNEGVVGPDGAFWVGTMQNNIKSNGDPKEITASSGAIYRVTVDGTVTRISEQTFGITNTLIWSGDRLITADTIENKIYSFGIDSSTGMLEDRRTILEGFDRGLPDGSTPDIEGAFWNCRVVGGACLLRLSAQGELINTIDLPVTWPTSCAFGGTNLDQLFVTSARFTMGKDHLDSNPQEGSLVQVEVGMKGTQENVFGVP